MPVSRFYWSAYLAWHLRGQARYPFRPLASILRDQSRRMRAMVAYAYRHVPYYRETMDRLGLTPDDFRTAEDLARLPLLETDVYHRDPERFLSTAQPKERYLAVVTSGTSGVRRVIYHDARACLDNITHAERERCIVSNLLGHPLHYRELSLDMTRSDSTGDHIRDLTRRTAWMPRKVGIERRTLSFFEPLEDQVAAINEFRPDVVFFVGGHLITFFSYLKRTGATCHLPAAVTYGSEGATEAARRLVMEEFGVPVISTYQASEALKVGFECEQHLGFHLNVDLYPVCLIDGEGRPVAPGETGSVVLSNLVNHATVLLNYHLGDLTTLSPGPCPCGRTLPLTSFLQGRTRDWLELPDRTVNPWTVEKIFFAQEHLWQHQVVQESPDRLRVLVVVAPEADRERLTAEVLEGLRRVCGDAITVDLRLVEEIPRSAGGKFRPIIALDRAPFG
jgi:phenylacetate-CoA ligase